MMKSPMKRGIPQMATVEKDVNGSPLLTAAKGSCSTPMPPSEVVFGGYRH